MSLAVRREVTMGILKERKMASESGQPIERCPVKQELKASDVKLLKNGA